MSNIIVFRSQYFGAGKTIAGLSFNRPGVEPKRLVYDPEVRAGVYKSPDNQDHPELLQFAFDFLSHDNPIEELISFVVAARAGKHKYNVLILDDATFLQDTLKDYVVDKASAMRITDALGATRALVTRDVNPRDTASYYYLLKGIIKRYLIEMRKANIDVIITSESKNVWQNYGKRGRDPATHEPYMKIVGVTAKLWDPWMQMADALFVLSRIQGDRMTGKGKLMPYPIAELDTFNTKCSIVGVQPRFTFNSWDVFWDMAEKRRVPTAADFAKLNVEGAVSVESEEPMTLDDAKAIVVQYAISLGVVKSAKELGDMGRKNGLDSRNLLAQYDRWIEMIEEASK